MSYEKEQARLLQLINESDPYVTEYDDSEDDDEIDNIEIFDEDTASEQDLSDVEEDPVTSNEPYFLGKDGTTKWNKHFPTRNVRTRSENIITHLPGVKGEAKKKNTPTDIWQCFIDDYVFNIIVENTNKFITAGNYPVSNRTAGLTDKIEIKALLGLLYLSGVRKTNHVNASDLWKKNGTAIEMFRLTMSLQRFRFLLRHLRFDDKVTRLERKKLDKLCPIRELFDRFNSNCQKHYSMSQYVTIDEKLEAFRGRCGFRVYIPSKPNKYGIKIFALADAKMFYTANMEVYVGTQPKGPYNVSNSPSAVVERLCKPISDTKRNLTIDNWFTSKELADSLLKNHKLTVVGTLRKNKRQLPSEFVQGKRPISSSMFGFQENCTLVSFIPKQNKNVLLLSTLHHDDCIDPQTGKPEIIMLYNSTKGGVDVVDKLCASYNVARATRRWPTVVFYSVLNVAAINAYVIFLANNNSSKTPRSQFLEELALSLLEEHLRRKALNKRLPKLMRLRIRELLNLSEENVPEERNNVPGRCSYCSSKKNRKTKYSCKQCGKFMCLEHCVMVCHDCLDGHGHEMDSDEMDID